MEFLKKVNALVLGLAVLLAVGCGGDEPEPDNSNNPVSQDCIITALEYLDVSNTTRIEFEFDSQRRFIKANYRVNGILQNAYRLVEYDNAGRISKIAYQGGSSGSNQDGDFQLYTYNTAGLLIRKEYHRVDNGQATLVNYLTYTYDSNNKLIRKDSYDIEQTNFLAAYSLYSYPSSNTASEEKYHLEINGAPLKHIKTITYNFDNKRTIHQLLGVFSQEDFLSPFNIIREESIRPASPNPPSVNTYTYQFNNEGFPTVITDFNGTVTRTTNLTYNCQ